MSIPQNSVWKTRLVEHGSQLENRGRPDVIVAAMRSPGGASAAILRAVRREKVELLLSVPLAMEYEAVA